MLDIQIIRALASPGSFQWDVHVPVARVAEGLHVDEETVRNRLRRMKHARFLKGWHLILNPHLLGRTASTVELSIADARSKDDVISQVSMVDGVMMVDDFFGSGFAVTVWHKGAASLQAAVESLASLTGCPSPVAWTLAFPPCGLSPTRTDWRIMAALRANGRERLSFVASRLGISTRTVKRRLASMVEGKALYLDPVLDLRNVGGARFRFWLRVEEIRKRAVDRAIISNLPKIVSMHTEPREHSVFAAHLSNAAESARIVDWMAGLVGVREVRPNLEVAHLHTEEWLDDEVKKRLSPTMMLAQDGGAFSSNAMGATA